jgi:DNA (cytosine-5)-methyltransferase 1
MGAYYNEIDPYCCRVLRKQIAAGNLPPGDVDERDIREVTPDDLRGYQQVHLFAGIGGIPLGFRMAGVPDDFNIWTGGFPCQDISNAGKRAGIGGERSGLWSEYIRLVRLVRPRYVLVENVAALLGRGVDVVLGDLAESGYDAEWDCLPAAAVGAPHRRDRLFIIAHDESIGRGARGPRRPSDGRAGQCESQQSVQALADAHIGRHSAEATSIRPGRNTPEPRGEDLAHAERDRRQQGPQVFRTGQPLAPPSGEGRGGWWESEPDVGRVAHGVPARVDRLRGLGNAVVPQIAEWLGRRILECDQAPELAS